MAYSWHSFSILGISCTAQASGSVLKNSWSSACCALMRLSGLSDRKDCRKESVSLSILIAAAYFGFFLKMWAERLPS